MNIAEIKAQVEAMNAPKATRDYVKIDYTKVFWKPELGKHQMRIVPSVYNPDIPFIERQVIYGVTPYPLYSLNSWGEDDPFIDMVNELKKVDYNGNQELIKKLTPKSRFFIPVIVRNEEQKGVRYWEVGKNIYKELMSLAADDDYGDYTDVHKGNDFTVEVVNATVGGRDNMKSSSIRIKPKSSPLSKDESQITEWTTIQPNLDEINKKKTYDELKKILGKFLQAPSEAPSTTPVTKYSAPTPVSNSNKFDALFSDDLPY